MLLWFVIGLCLLGFLFIFARWASNLPTNPLKRGLKILLILVAGIGALIVLLRVGLSPILSGLLALTPAIIGNWKRFSQLSRRTQRTQGQTSRVSSIWLDMVLDHDTGKISGKVLKGRHAGRNLNNLSEKALDELAIECSDDHDSARLLSAYMTKRFGRRDTGEETRARGSQSRTGDSERAARMSRPEALSILGLVEPVTTAEINAAYKRLISKVHPDVGGNAFLASRVNEARDILLKKSAQ